METVLGNVEKAWRKDGATTNNLASFQTSGISAVAPGLHLQKTLHRAKLPSKGKGWAA